MPYFGVYEHLSYKDLVEFAANYLKRLCLNKYFNIGLLQSIPAPAFTSVSIAHIISGKREPINKLWRGVFPCTSMRDRRKNTIFVGYIGISSISNHRVK